ncbi:MAG: uracil-DNA glycosylase [Candidatus Aenigmarchaeota archaeon]|nr:uracil-DNA glycosylase [Candidatus Aenigmarchaeota archaeon]
MNRRPPPCTNCPLSKSRKNAVFGDGPHDARIVIVGEAPGRDEDEQGRPFVGMSGRELTKMLDEVGIRREEVFITNTVKCRPPDNRKPSANEIEACRQHLAAQLSSIKPALICTLGNVPLNSIIGKHSIGDVNGHVMEKDGSAFLPLYHPASWLYNRKLREKAKKGYEKIKTISMEKQ